MDITKGDRVLFHYAGSYMIGKVVEVFSEHLKIRVGYSLIVEKSRVLDVKKKKNSWWRRG